MRRNTDKPKRRTSRRAFLASSGALAAGMYLARPSIARAAETLAMHGGKQAVTASASGATSWPRFGADERKAVDAVVSNPGYGEIEAFERDWKEHFKKYGTGLGMKLRMHPMGAALARCQLRKMDEQTEMERAQHHELNSRLCQLPGIYEQAPGPGVKRVYWAHNHLFIDPVKAGMSRDTAVKALSAEGVSVNNFGYSVSHRDAAFREPQWWHHMPVIPDRLPGLEEIERTGISLPRFTKPVPELIDQYVKAFEKVWAHRAELGRA